MAKIRVGCYELVAHPPCDEVSKSYGVRYRTCHVWSAFNIDHRVVGKYWLEHTLAARPSKDKLRESDRPDSTPKLLSAQIEKAA
jgi:hypothetical protein